MAARTRSLANKTRLDSVDGGRVDGQGRRQIQFFRCEIRTPAENDLPLIPRGVRAWKVHLARVIRAGRQHRAMDGGERKHRACDELPIFHGRFGGRATADKGGLTEEFS